MQIFTHQNSSEKPPESPQEAKTAASQAVNASSSVQETTDVSGSIAEVMSDVPAEDMKDSSAQSTQQKSQAPLTVEERLKVIEKNMPSRGSMEHEVASKIQNEIRHLEGEVSSLRRKEQYYLLNNLYLRICELRGILSELAAASFEYLKSLWLRYVHGIVL